MILRGTHRFADGAEREFADIIIGRFVYHWRGRVDCPRLYWVREWALTPRGYRYAKRSVPLIRHAWEWLTSARYRRRGRIAWGG